MHVLTPYMQCADIVQISMHMLTLCMHALTIAPMQKGLSGLLSLQLPQVQNNIFNVPFTKSLQIKMSNDQCITAKNKK